METLHFSFTLDIPPFLASGMQAGQSVSGPVLERESVGCGAYLFSTLQLETLNHQPYYLPLSL